MVSFSMTLRLSHLAKFSMARSIVRSLCDSCASCLTEGGKGERGEGKGAKFWGAKSVVFLIVLKILLVRRLSGWRFGLIW